MKYLVSLFFMLALVGPTLANTTKEEQKLMASFMNGWTFWSQSHPERQVIDLPHDAMQTEKRDPGMAEGRHSGYFPGGVYHYEKVFNFSQKSCSKHVVVKFEGVYRNATVKINNEIVGCNKFGWSAFSVVLDGHLHAGRNVLHVEADNSLMPNSRWYTGAGIYRPVHLVIKDKVHIAGVRKTTTSISECQPKSPVSAKVQDSLMHSATLTVDTQHKGGDVSVAVYDEGKMVSKGIGGHAVLRINHARLWSAESPHLYTVKVTLKDKGKVVDTEEEQVGIRQITWSHDRGLMVNGQTVKLRGGCLHSDNGILGAAEYDEMAMRKVAILKQYGYNAIRSAHNPCSEAILRACDRLGMYVMDELWDVWYDHKTPYDYAADFRSNYETDVKSIVNKDYNHPSVIMYSIANEPTEVAKVEGVDMSKKIVARLHQLDASRPVTAGINMVIAYMSSLGISLTGSATKTEEKKMTSEKYNNLMATSDERLMNGVCKPEVDSVTTTVFATLDIAGYNYGNRRYELDATAHPQRIIVGTETYVSSLPENWALVERLPYLIGDFQWTAWDYIGETGIGAWFYSADAPTTSKPYPWKLAGAGALDLLGHPTGEALLVKSVWLHDDKPYMAVRPLEKLPLVKASWRGTNSIPSWSWRGCEGMTATVEVFTSAPKVELLLNDSLIGSGDVKNHLATFRVPYRPGVLKAVAIGHDGHRQQTELQSSTGPLAIALRPQNTGLDNIKDSRLLVVDIDIVGENGIVESKADKKLKVEVEGGKLLAFGSARPFTTENFADGEYTIYYGQSQAIILRNKPQGKVTLKVSGEGLPTAERRM
jgi:beta-galactosidase